MMDRQTFRAIIVVSTMQKRQRYEESLQSMPLFAGLTSDQRAVIADCLSLETFQVCCMLHITIQQTCITAACFCIKGVGSRLFPCRNGSFHGMSSSVSDPVMQAEQNGILSPKSFSIRQGNMRQLGTLSTSHGISK